MLAPNILSLWELMQSVNTWTLFWGAHVLGSMTADNGDTVSSDDHKATVRKLAVAPPIAGPGLVTWIAHTFPARFDDEEALGLPGILRLVPLQLAITDEAPFVRPALRIGFTRAVELVRPDKRIAHLLWSRANGYDRGRGARAG